jgi:2-polyprenyl-3-methyl-5-hydroxy-6-metoxy-1,4-benzoquinol methylase
MITAKQCVLCGGEIVTRKQGVVAPFLARRIWNGKPPAVELVECRSCTFLFFNPRLEPEEEQRLYTGYRLEEYQRMRHSCEPWYTPGFNAKLPSYTMGRREKLGSVLKPFVEGLEKPSILDFGGDRGQLIQGLIPNASGYVYDISEVESLEGIGYCRDLEECRKQQFDLIICSNVLEHVGFPGTIMDQIKEIAAPKTLIFIEVPFESPFGSTLVMRRLAQIGILAVTRPSVAQMLAKPGFLYLMHEHINYYNSKALETLMKTSGGTVVASDSYLCEGQIGKGTMGWCLGRMAA